MKSVILVSCLLAVWTLAGCTPAPINAQPPVQRERAAYLKQTGSIPLTCTVGADCTTKWTRAQQWVLQHSSYSVKTNTDSEISTLGPVEPTTDSAFTVTQSPQDATTHSINFSSTCGSTPICSPTTPELESSFKNFVLYGN